MVADGLGASRTPLPAHELLDAKEKLRHREAEVEKLKRIIRAQNAKILELREDVRNLEFLSQREAAQVPSLGISVLMSEKEASDFKAMQAECSDARMQATIHKAEAASRKREIETLKKVIRRLRSLLEYAGISEPQPPPRKAPSRFRRGSLTGLTVERVNFIESALNRGSSPGSESEDSASHASGYSKSNSKHAVEMRSMPSEARSFHSTRSLALSEARTRSCLGSPRPTTSGSKDVLDESDIEDSDECKRKLRWGRSGSSPTSDSDVPSRKRREPGRPLTKLFSALPCFWRQKCESSFVVLRALADIASRLCEFSVAATIYLVDPWMRRDASRESEVVSTLFYLGQGKTELQVFARAGDRPEPPRFQDFSCLPYLSPSILAVSLELPSSGRRVAVIQLHRPDDRRYLERKSLINTQPMPDVLKKVVGKPSPSGESSKFSATHMKMLHLACMMAGGLLEPLQHRQQQAQLVERMNSCLEVAVVVSKAQSLRDFEQRMKHLLRDFFSAAFVRVLFYNEETDKLVVSSAQMAQTRRKDVMQISLDKGVVGLAARRQDVIHVPNISLHAFVDQKADGLDGKEMRGQVSFKAEMMCGPMILDYDEGKRLVGVLQLIEHREAKGQEKDTTSAKEWSPEDIALFKQILRVCASTALRTLKLQMLAAVAEGQTGTTLIRLLS